jgi:putative transposase
MPVAYCLMPNHYHFLIRQDGEQPAGLLPQHIFNSYVKAYNKRYDHTGTLFEGHFHTRHIQNYEHLMHLCRYIHANPVKDGFAAAPADWQYSNYLDWIGKREGRLVDRNFIKENFANQNEYKDFVLDYLRTRQLPDDVRVYINSFES